jgi:RNA polymerase sigma factor (sigma-70 family)
MTRHQGLLQHIRETLSGVALDSRPDSVLLKRFVEAHDEEAFAALVARYAPLVLGVGRRVLGDAHEAEDVLQATFLVLARDPATIRRPAALAAWLHETARRLALRCRRSAARRRRREASPTSPASCRHANPLDELTARELLDIVDEEVMRLPEVYRLPVVLCYLEGLTQEEAAQRLDWTPGSVKGRLERGRKELHAFLARRGISLSGAFGVLSVSRGLVHAAGTSPAGLARSTLELAAGGHFSSPAAALADRLAGGRLRALVLLVVTLASSAGLALGLWQTKPPGGVQASAVAPVPRAAMRTDPLGDPLPPGVIARLGTIRFRGVSEVMAFSPDGKTLATGSVAAGLATVSGPDGPALRRRTEEHVTLWDPTTGRPIRQLHGIAIVRRLAYSADGRSVAASGSDRGVVWEVASGRQLWTFQGSYGAFGGDGKLLVSGEPYGVGARVYVHDAKTGRVLRHWNVEKGVANLVLAPNGRSLALVDQARPEEVQVREVVSGRVLCTVRFKGRAAKHLALSPDGSLLASAEGDGVRLWEVATGKVVVSCPQRSDSPPTFSRDGKRVAWTGYDNEMGIARVWVMERGTLRPGRTRSVSARAVGTPVNSFAGPCFNHDGKVLAVLTDGHLVELRTIADGKAVVPLDAHASPVYWLQFFADGARVLSRDRLGVMAWDANSGRLLRRFPDRRMESVDLLALLPTGRFLVTDWPARRFRAVDARTGREAWGFDGRPDLDWSAVSPGGRHLLVRGRKGEACVLDLNDGRCQWQFEPDGALSSPHLSSDGKVVVWHRPAGKRCEVFLRRAGAARPLLLTTLPERAPEIRWLETGRCLSPDGRWLVLPGGESRLRRWDLVTGKEAAPLLGGTRSAYQITWSPDGRLAAVRGSAAPAEVIDREARRAVEVWDVEAATRLRQIAIPDTGLTPLFSPDGRTLFLGDLAGEVRLWEVATGKERLKLTGHLGGSIGALALSPDGRRLASGGGDSQVLVWDLTGRAADGAWRTGKLPNEQRRRAWEALAGEARTAYTARWTLASDPDGVVTSLRQHLRPARRPDQKQVRQLLADLDHDAAGVRQKAEEGLEKLGEVVADEVQRALAETGSAEARRRLRRLVAGLKRLPLQESSVREVRAIELLESLGTREARGLLEVLAGGAESATRTREAAQALRRLSTAQSRR